MMVIVKWSPHLYLDPWAFSSYFLTLSCWGGEWGSTWVGGCRPRSTHHNFTGLQSRPYLKLLCCLKAELAQSFSAVLATFGIKRWGIPGSCCACHMEDRCKGRIGVPERGRGRFLGLQILLQNWEEECKKQQWQKTGRSAASGTPPFPLVAAAAQGC